MPRQSIESSGNDSQRPQLPELTSTFMSDFELIFPTYIGRKRNSEAVARGYPDRHGFEGDGEKIHILGARGEAAFAKVKHVVWEGTVNTFKSGGDVRRVQVRTRSKHSYDLLIRDDDDPGQEYVLVTSERPNWYVIWGWFWGKDARRQEWRQSYGGREPAWFVPQGLLRPIHLLSI